MTIAPVRILLIDDDETFFLLFRRTLSKVSGKKFVTDWAPDYEQGLATLQQNRHEACLLDYRLGSHTGLELLREAMGRGVQTPIIILTGLNDPKVDLEATELGAADFLVKDQLDPVVLERVIRYSVQHAETLKALQKSHERFRLLFERSLDAILISDESGKFVEVNSAACKLLGWTREQLLQGKWRDLPKTLQEHAQARSEETTELSFTKPNGENCFIEFISTKLAPNLYINILRDFTDRRALEHEIQEISEREQRRLGQDLHDGLGQSLTGIAFLAKVLQQKLHANFAQEAEAAGNIATLLNEALAQTRRLSRGLCPVVLDSNDIETALEQLAENVRTIFSVSCELQCEPDIQIPNNAASVHLYRIAQEAATNAIKHGRAKNILLSLTQSNSQVTLKITDDGAGFPPTANKGKGMGLRVMQHRARMIGGTVRWRQSKAGGVIVTCTLPRPQN
jgi:PAS domain S-box-containing protein